MISVSDIVILAASSTLLAVAMARTDLSGNTLPATGAAPIAYSTTTFDSTPVEEPAVINADQIDASTLASDGTVIVTTGSDTSAAFKEPEIIREATFNTHIVQSGEYLSLLAQRYNTTVSELQALNNLTSSKILVGQKIAYPSP